MLGEEAQLDVAFLRENWMDRREENLSNKTEKSNVVEMGEGDLHGTIWEIILKIRSDETRRGENLIRNNKGVQTCRQSNDMSSISSTQHINEIVAQ